MIGAISIEYWQFHLVSHHSGPYSSCWCSITRLLLTHRASRRRMRVPSLWWSSARRSRHVTAGVQSYHSFGHSLGLYFLVITKRSLQPVWLFFMVSHFDFNRTFSRPLPLFLKPCSSPCTTTCFFSDLYIPIRTHAHLTLTSL